jgi:hypothetical protein
MTHVSNAFLCKPAHDANRCVVRLLLLIYAASLPFNWDRDAEKTIAIPAATQGPALTSRAEPPISVVDDD